MMKEKIKDKIKYLTEEEAKELCDSLKNIFKGGVRILNPENYQSAMASYYENLEKVQANES